MNSNEIIRNLREEKGLSQKQMAEILKTTQKGYSKYETKKCKIPLRHLIALSKFYKVTADYILGLTDSANVICIEDLTAQEREYILNYSRLTPAKKRKMDAFVQALLNKNKNL